MIQRKGRNFLVLASLAVILAAMVGMVSYSVTLYRLFCAVTGAGGATQRAAENATVATDQVITVRFNTDVAPDLPWRFQPEQREVKVRLGENALVFFSARNLSDKPVVGHAVYNVTPEATGVYFYKIQCFCFTEERLEPGQSVQMPVDFYIDPKFGEDPNTRDIRTITLSYAFMRSPRTDGVEEMGRFADVAQRRQVAGAAHGEALFAARCASCHSLSANKAGPLLGGVVGRAVASVPGFSYSPALRERHFAWTRLNLDRWLMSPRDFVPGTRMPVSVASPQDRQDIIAFLAAQGTGASATH